MIPELEVLVATFGEAGLRRALEQDWPRVEGVRYLVCCQNPGGEDLLPAAEALHSRGDTVVLFFRDRGLSLNRNHCLDAASAPYLMIMDDDLRLSAEGLEAVIALFRSRPDLDYFTTFAEVPDHTGRRLPPPGHDLARPWPRYWAISFEIALRRSSLERVGARFTPLAGIGAPYLGAGEENLFLHRLVRLGLHGEFSGILIGVHDHPTTSERAALDPAVARAKGAAMRVLRGNLAAAIRLPLEAHRSALPFFRALLYLSQGYIYSIIHRREL